MSRRLQSSSTIGRRGSESEDFLGSDNLHVSLSLSSASNFRKIVRPAVSRKDKSRSEAKKTTERMPVVATSKGSRRTGVPTSGIPADVAVHFGNFYRPGEDSRKYSVCRDAGTNNFEFPARSEFTGQMVHKLERLAGTEHYARQLSALLDETVESPNFAVNPPPADNFVPCETSEPTNYPLWYKEPDELPSWTRECSSSTGRRTKGANERTKNIRSGEFTRRASDSGSRGSDDVTDCENNDESSSTSSDRSLRDANTEGDSDYEVAEIATRSSSKEK